MSLIRVTKLEEFWQIPTLGVFTLSNKAIVLKRRFNSIAWDIVSGFFEGVFFLLYLEMEETKGKETTRNNFAGVKN